MYKCTVYFSECSSISGKVCVTPPVATSRFYQGKGRQYRLTWIQAEQPTYAMQREQESLHHSRRGKRSHAGVRHEKGSRTVLFLVAHALRRSQFSPSESLLRPSLRFRSVFPVENFTMRKFSTGNRRENAEFRRDGRTLMRKGKIVRFINTISSYGIAYFLLHLFQLMGQDFHVAADLLVGYPGIYLGGFQIRMPQKTAYGLDGHTVRE